MRSFATALPQWWTFLEHRDEAEGWDRLGVPAMAAFVRWLHDGRHRETVATAPMVAAGAGGGLSVSTWEARLAAVTSFYRWQEAVHQVTVAHRLLKGASHRAPARGLLAHWPAGVRWSRPGRSACAVRAGATGDDGDQAGPDLLVAVERLCGVRSRAGRRWRPRAG
ncbi:hypothetical protein [Nonomuraea sp. NPDC003804]|uniref:hypothetical protein n=1 Tax=Nonomuraea sp. NPDC003804 TaxID=3154547 RepID=UPI0033B815DB